MQQRAAKCFAALLWGGVLVGGIWLLVRFLLPWTAPFIVALAAAALMEPGVKSLCRRGLRRSVAAMMMSLAVLTLVSTLAVWLSYRGISALTDFAACVPELADSLSRQLGKLENRVFAYVSTAPEEVSRYLKTALDAVAESLYSIPAALSQWVLDVLTRAAQSSPDFLLFAVTAGIGTYFISASYPKTLAFLSAQLPDSLRRRAEGLGQDLKSSFGGWLRAQLILMAMTFFELLAAFLLLKVKGAALIAALTAFVDALPVFGTGIVLVPWAVYSFILGDTARGIGLLICWGVVNLVRSCVQAKLLGDQIGLDPLPSLLAMYVGWRVWRVWGMLLFPILFVTLRQLNDRGVIHLWKSA